MERQFDSVKFRKKGNSETVIVALSSFDGSKPEHIATAVVSNRSLRITASVDGKNYGQTIDDVDLEAGTKVERGKGLFKVLVKKTADFSLEDKYSP